MSHPIPDEQAPSAEPDPLLEFFAEPEPEPVKAAASPPVDPAEPVVNAEDPAPPPVAPPEPAVDPETIRRLDRVERMLEKTQIEMSALKSDVATLVGAIDDIKKRQSRPATQPPANPLKPPAPASRTRAAVAVVATVVLTLVSWAAWSLASYEMPELEAEVGAANAPVAEPRAMTEPQAPVATDPPVAIAKAAAVSIVEPARPAAAPPQRVARPDAAEREPSPAVTQYFGTLSIDSSPAGEVFVDRKSVGKTPARVEKLRAGSHLVWIERDGFQRWTRVVSVGADRVSRVSAELEPVR